MLAHQFFLNVTSAFKAPFYKYIQDFAVKPNFTLVDVKGLTVRQTV